MTMLDREAGIDGSPRIVFRLTTLLFAVLLGAQCLWLVLAELARPSINQLPTDWPLLPLPPNNVMLPFARHQLVPFAAIYGLRSPFRTPTSCGAKKMKRSHTRTLLRHCCVHVQLSITLSMMALINPAPGCSSPS